MNLLPFVVNSSMLYALPSTNPPVRVTSNVPVSPARTSAAVVADAVTLFPDTVAVAVIITSVVPVFRMLTDIESVSIPATLENVALVIDICSVSMNVKVIDPIHAATAMDTATVTAMSMMAATTGLKAFLLFRNFFIFVLSLLVSSQVN